MPKTPPLKVDEKRATIQKKIQALSFCIDSTRGAHGAVIGDPSFPHTPEPGRCRCGYGEAIRITKAIRQELYAQISESRKARKTAKR